MNKMNWKPGTGRSNRGTAVQGIGESTAMTPAQKAAETRARKAATRARLEQARKEAIAIVADGKGKCPRCGSGLVRNNALAGWWQCAQYGRGRDKSKPECGFQCFTE